MKKIILYGAYDRYNYGDNLMPILLNEFIKKYRPSIYENFELSFASISKSDLSNYKCLPTEKLSNVILSSKAGSTIVVTGGEVVGATRETLFFHNINNDFIYKIAHFLKFNAPRFYSLFCKIGGYGVSKFPYMPTPDGHHRVVFNTIGGEVLGAQNTIDILSESLKNSSYTSVRDTRTLDSLSPYVKANLVPDSVHILPKLIDDNYIEQQISNRILEYTNKTYVVLQASPFKLSKNLDNLVSAITKIYDETGNKVVLLPIGYASGHDDYDLLRTINEKIEQETTLLFDLNVWEILYVIKNSLCFYGTSLHGIITAMSYGVPHFCINENVKKVEAYIKQWSIAPYDKPVSIDNIESTFNYFSKNHILTEIAEELAERVYMNNLALLNVILEE